MSKEIEQTVSQTEMPTVVYEINGSLYTVGIHFREDAAETLSDKLRRMIRRDVAEGEE